MATPKQAREEKEQVALFNWARLVHPPVADDIEASTTVADYLFAIPNGGKRNKREAARMKAAGVLAGVSDIHLPIARGGFLGLWIELKAKTPRRPANGGPMRLTNEAKPTPAQLAWLDRMTRAGHFAAVVWGWEAARDTIWSYLHADLPADDRPDLQLGKRPCERPSSTS